MAQYFTSKISYNILQDVKIFKTKIVANVFTLRRRRVLIVRIYFVLYMLNSLLRYQSGFPIRPG